MLKETRTQHRYRKAIEAAIYRCNCVINKHYGKKSDYKRELAERLVIIENELPNLSPFGNTYAYKKAEQLEIREKLGTQFNYKMGTDAGIDQFSICVFRSDNTIEFLCATKDKSFYSQEVERLASFYNIPKSNIVYEIPKT